MRKARDYQLACIEAVCRSINQGERRLYYVLPTGTGKTRIMTLLVDLFAYQGRILVVAHRKELIQQTAAAIREDIDGAAVGVVMAEQNEISASITVGTWQSLTPLRLEAVLSASLEPFSLVIFDESHHAIPGSAYERIAEAVQQHSPNAAVVGCTATPFRSDACKMQGVLPCCAYMKTIPDMQRLGWLAPVKWQALRLPMDLSSIKKASVQGETDYNQEELYQAVSPQTAAIVRKTLPFFAGRPAMIFAVNVAHAYELAEAYRAAGIACTALDASTPRSLRQSTLEMWKCGVIQAVVNVALFTEGFDYTPFAPNKNGLGLVINACPVQSPSRYLQMVGRGTRLKPDDGDFKDCIVLDIAGNGNLLETRQVLLPKVMPTLQEDVFENRESLVEFDGKLEEELEQKEENKKPTLLRINDPLATSWIAWGYNRLNNIYHSSLAVSEKGAAIKEQSYAVILPSLRGDGLFRACILTKRGHLWDDPQWVVDRATPLNELMHHINHIIAANGLKALLNKGAQWRKRGPSPAQLNFLKMQSPKYYTLAIKYNWNQGEVSCALNWVQLMPQLKYLVEKERERVHATR